MTRSEKDNEDNPLVSLVIITYNGKRWIGQCLTSIGNMTYKPLEVIIVDNASSDTSVQYIEDQFPWVRIIKNKENFGYAQGCNIGASHAKGEIIAFLNQDVRIDQYWLSHVVPALKDENVGACCCKILDYDGRKILFPTESDALYASKHQETKNVPGAAFATRKDIIEKIGLFDPEFFMYYDEIDWSWRLRLANYKCIYVPDAVAYHWVGGSKTPLDRIVYLTIRNRIRTLIKNCEFKTLLSFVPSAALEVAYSFSSSFHDFETFSRFPENPERRAKGLVLFKEGLKAMIVNILNIRDTLNERRKVQKIRVNSDESIRAKEQDFFYSKFLKIRRGKRSPV